MNKNKLIIILSTLMISIVAHANQAILDSPLAGFWYSSNPDALINQIDKYLNNVKEKKIDNLIALILPHAGYAYSGQTAAYGIKEIKGEKYTRVIILGPSHQRFMKNLISLPKDIKAIKTPLGTIPLDNNFIDKMKNNPEVIQNNQTHYSEHSVQIELPLLQSALGKFQLVPIIVGHLDATTAKKIGNILYSLMDDNTLVIVSSDFTHYGKKFRYTPFPLNGQTQKNINKLDMNLIKEIENISFNGFNNYVKKTGITVCGNNPIMILLGMLPKETQATLLNYSTSGKLTGNFANSVSYAAIAFAGKWNTKFPKQKAKSKKDLLSQIDKSNLLKLAKKTLVYYLKNQTMPSPEKLGIKISPCMSKVMGVFVTLYKNGRLRGCIGEITPRRPLYVAVMNQVVNAAVRDYRFPKIKSEEIPNLKFEISALTPPEVVSSYKDIEIGKDDIILSKYDHSAIFLPQVATEQSWDLSQTLTHLSQKAGLPANAWKNDAKFSIFQAVVFK